VHFSPAAFLCTVVMSISFHAYLADVAELFVMRSFFEAESRVVGQDINFIVN